jgi:DNA-binding CsgD family transcriptional regulator
VKTSSEEVLGRYSNHADQGKRLGHLLQIELGRPSKARSQTQRQVHVRLTQPRIDDLVSAYRSGRTTYELANEFGIHRLTVSKILIREGVPRRNASLTPESVQEAALLYRSGLSLAAVGLHLGCDPNTVRLALMAAGEPRRDTHGRAVEL